MIWILYVIGYIVLAIGMTTYCIVRYDGDSDARDVAIGAAFLGIVWPATIFMVLFYMTFISIPNKIASKMRKEEK